MSNRVKFTPEQKMFFVLKFRELKMSLAEFCRMYNVERTAIHRWSIKYDNKGLEARSRAYARIGRAGQSDGRFGHLRSRRAVACACEEGQDYYHLLPNS